MKLIPSLCAAALTVCIGSGAAEPKAPQVLPSSADRAVEDRSRALIKAELDANVAAFRGFLSDDYVLLYVEPATSGQKARWATRTKEEWANLLSTGGEKYHSVDLRHTKVYLHGDVAIFAGEYTEKGTRDGEEYTEGGLFTETWAKRHGEWILVGGVFP
ncbi:MAG: nuclear transport factor 2 family protein [Steroidobacteraceae bacterium]